jgi:hypothetical protein
MPSKIKTCGQCHRPIKSPYLQITPTLVDGTTRLSYKAVLFCTETCLRNWADIIEWGGNAALQ